MDLSNTIFQAVLLENMRALLYVITSLQYKSEFQLKSKLAADPVNIFNGLVETQSSFLDPFDSAIRAVAFTVHSAIGVTPPLEGGFDTAIYSSLKASSHNLVETETSEISLINDINF